MLRSLHKTIIIAGLLFVADAYLLNQLLTVIGFICIGIPVFLVKLYRRRNDTERRRLLLARAAIYCCMVVLIITAFFANNKLAVMRAKPVIVACEQFRAKNGVYPQKLQQLVPEYLDSIPRAKFVLTGNSFFYVARPDEHDLCYTTVPPFGRSCYLLEQKKWQLLD